MSNKATKFHPILFSTPMVQAILEGRKTQTRRINIMKKTITYKKDKLYSPDSLDYLPKDCNPYFTQDELEQWGQGEYEFGTLKCIKSFKITITITELD